MDFVAVVDQAIALLHQRGRVTYRTLKRQFQLDDEHLEALKDEIIEAQQLAADEDGASAGLDRGRWPSLPLHRRPQRPHAAPLTYTPALSRREDPRPPAAPWKASASRSRCCSPTSKARRNSSRTATRKTPSSSSTPSWIG